MMLNIYNENAELTRHHARLVVPSAVDKYKAREDGGKTISEVRSGTLLQNMKEQLEEEKKKRVAAEDELNKLRLLIAVDDQAKATKDSLSTTSNSSRRHLLARERRRTSLRTARTSPEPPTEPRGISPPRSFLASPRRAVSFPFPRPSAPSHVSSSTPRDDPRQFYGAVAFNH
eukprot:TRINITY_DN38177_c0_g1_i1.p1 TRINITY_DN38177_c0_g1~~TRINITY_DN38177_c0_g1_i1.p1  ORF type:complete len:173 (+),score=26.74 TRINITY_DN38177_c0_g1_i1:55-573(+)